MRLFGPGSTRQRRPFVVVVVSQVKFGWWKRDAKYESISTILTSSFPVSLIISFLASSARCFDRQIMYTLAPFAAAYVVISFPKPELALVMSVVNWYYEAVDD